MVLKRQDEIRQGGAKIRRGGLDFCKPDNLNQNTINRLIIHEISDYYFEKLSYWAAYPSLHSGA